MDLWTEKEYDESLRVKLSDLIELSDSLTYNKNCSGNYVEILPMQFEGKYTKRTYLYKRVKTELGRNF